LESHGSNFFHGVKFSVQTISLGNDEYRNVRESLYREDVTPRLRKDTLGDAVFSGLMKFNEAQNCPERTLVKSRHCLSMLKQISGAARIQQNSKWKGNFSAKFCQSRSNAWICMICWEKEL
jgi:hypothetical protein